MDAFDTYRLLNLLTDADEPMLLELIRVSQHEDWNIRLNIIRIRARFQHQAVAEALPRLLADSQAQIRQAALEGLATLHLNSTVEALTSVARAR